MASVRGALTTLLASAAKTTSGTSANLNFGALSGQAPGRALFVLNATTVSGTNPTLDVYLQWTDGTLWYDFLHFTQATTTGLQSGSWTRYNADGGAANNVVTMGDAVLAAGKAIYGPIVDSSIRVKWVVGGTTPSFTFSLVAVTDTD